MKEINKFIYGVLGTHWITKRPNGSNWKVITSRLNVLKKICGIGAFKHVQF